MNLKKVLGKNRKSRDVELNVTPVMNIFVILIPFLLLTATFVKIAIIELTLPTLESIEYTNPEDLKDLTLLMVTINPEGFEIKTSENNFPKVLNTPDGFDFKKLAEQLEDIKLQYPKLEDVLISPADDIQYQVIIKVLDSCRDVGFPNFAITG